MKVIDIHTHLTAKDYDEDRGAMIERALMTCDYLIDIGSGTSSRAFEDARKLADSHSRIYFTSGIHPHDADTVGQDMSLRNDLSAILSHNKCVAVGECGLDYFYNHSPREKQAEVFEWQIDLARKHNLPLMIHTRDAEDDTKASLSSYSGRGVFHCFTGTYDLAKFGVDRGFLVSFSGIVTFKNAQALREVFLALPMDTIVIETDSPYLAPVPMRGKRNESSFIGHTARFLADLRKIPLEDFIDQTSQNALRLFEKINP